MLSYRPMCTQVRVCRHALDRGRQHLLAFSTFNRHDSQPELAAMLSVWLLPLHAFLLHAMHMMVAMHRRGCSVGEESIHRACCQQCCQQWGLDGQAADRVL